MLRNLKIYVFFHEFLLHGGGREKRIINLKFVTNINWSDYLRDAARNSFRNHEISSLVVVLFIQSREREREKIKEIFLETLKMRTHGMSCIKNLNYFFGAVHKLRILSLFCSRRGELTFAWASSRGGKRQSITRNERENRGIWHRLDFFSGTSHLIFPIFIVVGLARLSCNMGEWWNYLDTLPVDESWCDSLRPIQRTDLLLCVQKRHRITFPLNSIAIAVISCLSINFT